MPILRQQDAQALQRRFAAELKRDVKIKLVTQRDIGIYVPGRNCRSCGSTQNLMEEVCALSDRLDLQIVDYYGSDDAQTLGVEKIPAILMGAGGHDNARYYGLPTGFEFEVLVDSIFNASVRVGPLKLETRRQLRRLKEDVHIQVFVTPN